MNISEETKLYDAIEECIIEYWCEQENADEDQIANYCQKYFNIILPENLTVAYYDDTFFWEDGDKAADIYIDDELFGGVTFNTEQEEVMSYKEYCYITR